MKQGVLAYNRELRCGNTMNVFMESQWIPIRIEIPEDWYLVGTKTDALTGL